MWNRMPVMELSEALGSLVIYSEFSFLFPLRKSYLKLNSSRYKNCAHAQGFHRAASCPLPTTSLSPPLFPQVIPSMDSAEMVLFLPLSQTGRDTLVNSWNAVCFFLFVCFCLILCLDTVCNFKFTHVPLVYYWSLWRPWAPQVHRLCFAPVSYDSM